MRRKHCAERGHVPSVSLQGEGKKFYRSQPGRNIFPVIAHGFLWNPVLLCVGFSAGQLGQGFILVARAWLRPAKLREWRAGKLACSPLPCLRGRIAVLYAGCAARGATERSFMDWFPLFSLKASSCSKGFRLNTVSTRLDQFPQSRQRKDCWCYEGEPPGKRIRQFQLLGIRASTVWLVRVWLKCTFPRRVSRGRCLTAAAQCYSIR